MAEISKEEKVAQAEALVAEQKLAALTAARERDEADAVKAGTDAIAAAQKVAQDTVRALNAEFEQSRLAAAAELEAAKKAFADATARRISSDSAAALPDLGVTRSTATQVVRDLMGQKTPGDPTAAAKYDAQLRLAQDAQKRAEDAYAAALAAIHDDHLSDLVSS